MLTGIGFTASYIVYFKFIDPANNIADAWWFGISPEGIGTLGMLLNLRSRSVSVVSHKRHPMMFNPWC